MRFFDRAYNGVVWGSHPPYDSRWMTESFSSRWISNIASGNYSTIFKAEVMAMGLFARAFTRGRQDSVYLMLPHVS